MPLVIFKAHDLNVEELRELIAFKWLKWKIISLLQRSLEAYILSTITCHVHNSTREDDGNMLVTIDESTNLAGIEVENPCR